jgi:hypothetical protein
MFRRSKPQEPCESDIGAERVLEGWKYAGQPILVEQKEEKESKKRTSKQYSDKKLNEMIKQLL